MKDFGPSSAFSAERFESFNWRVREYNVFGNQLAPSRDIAHRFSVVQHIRYICHGGNLSSEERCGDALKMIFLTPVMQHIMCGIPMEDLQGVRTIYQPGAPRKKGHKIYIKDLPLTLSGKQKYTLEELLSTSHNYNVQLGGHALTDEVQEYRALICSECSLVNCGDNIEFTTSHDQFMYGILLATFATHNAVWCIVQGFLPLLSLDEQPILNPYDCPLLELSNTIFCTPSCNIKRHAPLVHECTNSCTFQETMQARTVERENILCNKLVFQHDWSNPTYCFNVYCT